jgi:hypothetical protein
MGMLGLPAMERAPAPQLETVELSALLMAKL